MARQKKRTKKKQKQIPLTDTLNTVSMETENARGMKSLASMNGRKVIGSGRQFFTPGN